MKNLDPDGIERLYFHIKNMNYGEYYPLQQDCYGTIDKSGLVELYKSREPQYGVPKEAFCEYTDDEKRRIEEIKSIIKIREEEMEDETEEWNQKSSMQKFILKMKGKTPKQLEELKDFLRSLPIKFEEKGRYKKSLIVNESSASTLEPPISETQISQNSNAKVDEIQI